MTERWYVRICGESPELHDEIYEEFPIAERAGSRLKFSCLSADVYEKLMRYCKGRGLRWPKSTIDHIDGISVSRMRDYSEAEFDQSEFLQLARGKLIATSMVTEERLLKRSDDDDFLIVKKIHKNVEIGHIGYGLFGVKTEVRARMESEGFVGLSFEEVDMQGRAGGEELWRISSNQMLPAILNETQETNMGGLVALDGYSGDPCLRFRQADLSGFDVARTREKFGHVGIQGTSKLVCSQRFRRFCDQLKGKLEWKMVFAG